MCIAPVTLASDKAPYSVQVACKTCWLCRKNRVNDLVGRSIAEDHTSKGTLAVTLTYSGDAPNSKTLVYADVQKFLKRLRKARFIVRYIVTGEYGSRKGRAHWHIILFFQNNLPARSECSCSFKAYCRCEHAPTSILIGRRFKWSLWPHGIAYVQEPDYGAFGYALKYVLKDQTQDVRTTHLAMSKKPPLGFRFFMDLADRHVEQHLTPRTPEYSFANVLDRKGKRRTFYLQGRMRELFYERFKIRHKLVHGTEPAPTSMSVFFEDKWAREWAEAYNPATPDRFVSYATPPDANPREAVQSYPIHGGFMLDVLRDGTFNLFQDWDDQPWHLHNVAAVIGVLEKLGVKPLHLERLRLSLERNPPFLSEKEPVSQSA